MLVPQRRPFGVGFLDPVFPEHALAGGDDRGNGLGAEGLGNRHQGHVLRAAPRLKAGFGDLPAYRGETGGGIGQGRRGYHRDRSVSPPSDTGNRALRPPAEHLQQAHLSSPGLTGRSSKHRPGVLDCPVKPANDTNGVGSTRKRSSAARPDLLLTKCPQRPGSVLAGEQSPGKPSGAVDRSAAMMS